MYIRTYMKNEQLMTLAIIYSFKNLFVAVQICNQCCSCNYFQLILGKIFYRVFFDRYINECLLYKNVVFLCFWIKWVWFAKKNGKNINLKNRKGLRLSLLLLLIICCYQKIQRKLIYYYMNVNAVPLPG
jgi:hypothetical protein